MKYRTTASVALLLVICVLASAQQQAPPRHHRHFRPDGHGRVLIFDAETGVWTYYEDGKAKSGHQYVHSGNSVRYEVVNINPFTTSAKINNAATAVKGDTLSADDKSLLGAALGAASTTTPAAAGGKPTTTGGGAGVKTPADTPQKSLTLDNVNTSGITLIQPPQAQIVASGKGPGVKSNNTAKTAGQAATMPSALQQRQMLNWTAEQFETYLTHEGQGLPGSYRAKLRRAQAMAAEYARVKRANEVRTKVKDAIDAAKGDPQKIKNALTPLDALRKESASDPKILVAIAETEAYAERQQMDAFKARLSAIDANIGDLKKRLSKCGTDLDTLKQAVKSLSNVSDLADAMQKVQTNPLHSFGEDPNIRPTVEQSAKTQQTVWDMRKDAESRTSLALQGLGGGSTPSDILKARATGWDTCQQDYKSVDSQLNGEKGNPTNKGLIPDIGSEISDVKAEISKSDDSAEIKTLNGRLDELQVGDQSVQSVANAYKSQATTINDALTKGEEAFKTSANLAASRYSDILRTRFIVGGIDQPGAPSTEVEENTYKISIELRKLKSDGTAGDLAVSEPADYNYDGVDPASVRPMLSVAYVFSTFFNENRTFGTVPVTSVPGFTSRIIQHDPTAWLTSTTAVFAHIPFTQSGADAWTFSFGASTDASRFYAGLGYVDGRVRGIVFSGGLALGKVDQLDNQKVGDLLTQDALPRTSQVIRPGFFLGISYRLGS